MTVIMMMMMIILLLQMFYVTVMFLNRCINVDTSVVV